MKERSDVIKDLEVIKALIEWEQPIDYQESLDYAISSLKTDEAYQIMYEGGEIYTKADMVAMLDKIREQIKSNLRGVEITLEVLIENDPLMPKMEGAKVTLEDCLEIIDKAESEVEDGKVN